MENKEYLRNYYQANKERIHQYNLKKRRKSDPYYGRKINNEEELESAAKTVLKKHPQGLKARELIGLLLPLEGQYRLGSPKSMGKFLNKTSGVESDKNRVWKLTGVE